MTGEFDLERFVEAQAGGVYERALAEVRAGGKRSHWMWFVFPQVAGLGSSAMARRYAISGTAEATAYLAHPVLGPRLLECCAAVAGLPAGTDMEAVFGPVDAAKLRSCLTLFETISAETVFGTLLGDWFDGSRDSATLQRLT